MASGQMTTLILHTAPLQIGSKLEPVCAPYSTLIHNDVGLTAAIARFRNGTRFRWNIVNNAQERPDFSRCGSADNSFVRFGIYKDRPRVLYEIDGWQCTAIYWCY